MLRDELGEVTALVRRREAEGPLQEFRLSRVVLRAELAPLAGAGKRTREGALSMVG